MYIHMYNTHYRNTMIYKSWRPTSGQFKTLTYSMATPWGMVSHLIGIRE